MNEKDENNNQNRPEKSPFSLPEGYFDSFAQKMMLKIELAEELKEFKVLSSIDKKLPFITPENYFADKAASAEASAELSAYPKLSSLRNKTVFGTPDFYFENAAQKIKSSVEASEELASYPSLASIRKENSFSVPQEYFENFSYEVRDRIFSSSKTSRFDNVLQLVFSRKTVYAMAAVLVVSLGIYYFSVQQKETFEPCQGLACLDKSDVLKENQLINMDDESLMEIVNPESLSKNLNKNLSEEEESSDKEQKEDFVLENVDVNDIVDEI
jgi:hypothetical protein